MTIVLFKAVDFETSAKENGEVVEAAITDVWLDTETRQCEVGVPKSKLFGITGGMEPGAQGTHHITLEEIKGLPPCTEDDLRELIAGTDFLVAHQADYERSFLTPEICGEARWICSLKCARRAWEEAPEYGLQSLRYWRGLKLDPALALPAHRAGPDTYVGAQVFAELARTETINDLVRWTKAPTHYVTCPIGKHKGQPWSALPHSYLTWMLNASEMEADLKHAALAEINRRREVGA